MTLTACYVVANEAALIADSLRSVKAYVDRYVVVDSVFKSNPLDATHSTDDTRAICERICAPLPLVYIESDHKMDEYEARNRYLSEVRTGEWILTIDGDEVLYGDHAAILALLDEMRESPGPIALQVYTTAVNFNGHGSDMDGETYVTAPTINTVGWMPKLYRKAAGTHHRRVVFPDGGATHNGIYTATGYIGDEMVTTDKAFIVNHHVRQDHAGYVADVIWELAQGAR